MSIVLGQAGAKVKAVASAPEALDALERWRPEVLVSDIGLPGDDGYVLMRKVRGLGRERGGGIPAVAVTAYARAEDRTAALAAGFHMHVAKPLDPAALAVIVADAATKRDAA